MHGYTP